MMLVSLLSAVTLVSSQFEPRVILDVFNYGLVAFHEAALHHHSGLAADDFQVDRAIVSNGDVSIGELLAIDDGIVAAGAVHVDQGAVVARDIFANGVRNDGAIAGRVKLLAAVAGLPPGALKWDLQDKFGNQYSWYNDAGEPGSYDGSGTLAGRRTEYTITDGEEFVHSVFEPDGSPLEHPDLNVIRAMVPPDIDYVAMKAEADRNDATYFTSQAQALSYLISHKVEETIDGKDVTTIRIGSVDAPEFLYVDDDLGIKLVHSGADDIQGGVIVADGIHLEGGLYVSGSFDFEPAEVPEGAYPKDYDALRVHALPYHFPAIITYPQPCGVGCRFDRTWRPSDTPAMTGIRSSLSFKAHETSGLSLDGVVYTEWEAHMHATASSDGARIRVNGALLAFDIHVCDYFKLHYEKAIARTRFLVPRR